MTTDSRSFSSERTDRLLVSMAAALALSEVVGEGQTDREDPDRWGPIDSVPFTDEPWLGGIVHVLVPEMALTEKQFLRARKLLVPLCFWTEGRRVVHLSHQIDRVVTVELSCSLFSGIHAPLSGEPRRPRRIVTDDPRVAEALAKGTDRECARDFATIEVAPIDAAKERAVTFFAKRLMRAVGT